MIFIWCPDEADLDDNFAKCSHGLLPIYPELKFTVWSLDWIFAYDEAAKVFGQFTKSYEISSERQGHKATILALAKNYVKKLFSSKPDRVEPVERSCTARTKFEELYEVAVATVDNEKHFQQAPSMTTT